MQFVLFCIVFLSKFIPVKAIALRKMRHVIATVIPVTDVDLRDDNSLLYGVYIAVCLWRSTAAIGCGTIR